VEPAVAEGLGGGLRIVEIAGAMRGPRTRISPIWPSGSGVRSSLTISTMPRRGVMPIWPGVSSSPAAWPRAMVPPSVEP
jgi:hypothetical protein